MNPSAYLALRWAVGAAAAANFAVAAGFALQQPWATSAWPWDVGPLSYLFLASMLAAVGAGAAWIAFSGETGSLPAGFLNLAVTMGGIGGWLLIDGGTLGGPAGLGAAVSALAVVNAGLFFASRRLPERGAPERLPALVRASYVLFTLVLVAVGVALILGVPDVMPWPVDPDVSVVFGWMFFGDAWYFAYAVVRPDWRAARTQLWSFLAYDVVLFVPLLRASGSAPPQLRDSVAVYLLILACSGALGVYYLLLNTRTRGWVPPAAPVRPPVT